MSLLTGPPTPSRGRSPGAPVVIRIVSYVVRQGLCRLVAPGSGSGSTKPCWCSTDRW